MSIEDKQICKALDRLHMTYAGYRAPCRWQYDSKADAYFCEHVSIPGVMVITEVNPIYTVG